jgi:hypothetical protein
MICLSGVVTRLSSRPSPLFESYELTVRIVGRMPVDGGWAQGKAIELGVLVEIEVTAPCSEEGCVCAEYGDFPQMCIRRSETTNQVDEALRREGEEKV